jgi:hypothetical protein
MIDNLNKRNISYSFNFVFGADTDDPSVFSATLKFLQKHKVPAAYFNVLAPLRGTAVYEQLKAEDRLVDEPNMDRWPGVFHHFRPLRMSGEQLVAEVQKMQRAYYSLGSMVRRLRLPRTQADLASWNVNLTQRKVALHPDSMSEFSEF